MVNSMTLQTFSLPYSISLAKKEFWLELGLNNNPMSILARLTLGNNR